MLLNLAIMLVSLGTLYGILSTRIGGAESSLIVFQQRYEREVVPRAEHLQMNSVLEQRLSAIIERQLEEQKRGETMQSKIDELLRRK